MARLKEKYFKEIVPQLKEEFGYRSVMEVPRVSKVTLNMGVGEAKTNAKLLDAAVEDLALISGQRPAITKARKSIASFKLREGMSIGCRVTLRGRAMETRRSIISYMRSPRRVTRQPMDMPSRSLKLAMDLRALVIAGRWPLMSARSSTAASSSLALVLASPTPMLRVTLVTRGTSITLR